MVELFESPWHYALVAPLAILLIFLYQVVDDKYYNYRAKKAGAAYVPIQYHFPLGIPEVLKSIMAINSDQFLNRLEDLADTGKEKTVRQVLMGQTWIASYDAEVVKAVLASNFKDFSLGFRWNSFFPLLGNGIFTLSGEGWKHSRAMLRPQFARDQVSHLVSVKNHVNVLMDRFRRESADGNTVDAQALFHLLTLDTATEFLFGESSDTLLPNSRGVKGPKGFVTGQDFADAFSSSLYQLAVRVLCGPVYFLADSFGFRSNVSICHNFVDYFVLKALENPMEKDEQSGRYVFISELTKETRDPKVIRDQAFNILLAGRDTTASLLSYTTFYLAQNKDVYAKLREAVLNEFGDDIDGVTFESLKRCKYLQNVINEVLRLHPIVPTNFRAAIRDTVLPRGGGPNGDEPIFVPKGTNVFYLPYVMQRHNDYWGETSDDFIPERWNENMASHTWDYVPFNGGPRICLGQQFALTEATLVLVRLAQQFKDITVYNPDPITTNPRNMKQIMRLTSSVSGGVIANFTPA